jgi:hypothetical protein
MAEVMGKMVTRFLAVQASCAGSSRPEVVGDEVELGLPVSGLDQPLV